MAGTRHRGHGGAGVPAVGRGEAAFTVGLTGF